MSDDNKEGAGVPVAVVGEGFAIFWAGSGPIAPIVEKHGLKVGSMLYATPPAVMPAAPSEGVTEFNVGRWCLSEDDCIAGGIDFSAYERGVSDAATAFSRNTSKAATSHSTEPTSNAFDVAARLVRELQDETATRDKEAWMREASVTLQRLALHARTVAPQAEPAAGEPAGAVDEIEQLREQRDALRRALEVIAVGDSPDPVRDAGDELVGLGYWRKEGLAGHRALAAPGSAIAAREQEDKS